MFISDWEREADRWTHTSEQLRKKSNNTFRNPEILNLADIFLDEAKHIGQLPPLLNPSYY